MREKTAMVTREAGERLPPDGRDGELLAVALAAALVEYKKCVRDAACRQERATQGAQWRTFVRWEQLAGARRA